LETSAKEEVMSESRSNAYKVWNPFRYLIFNIFINPVTGTLILVVLSLLLWQNWGATQLAEGKWICAVSIGALQLLMIWMSVAEQTGIEASVHELEATRVRIAELEATREIITKLEVIRRRATVVEEALFNFHTALMWKVTASRTHSRRVNAILFDIRRIVLLMAKCLRGQGVEIAPGREVPIEALDLGVVNCELRRPFLAACAVRIDVEETGEPISDGDRPTDAEHVSNMLYLTRALSLWASQQASPRVITDGHSLDNLLDVLEELLRHASNSVTANRLFSREHVNESVARLERIAPSETR
jgi:hypothetical protein